MLWQLPDLGSGQRLSGRTGFSCHLDVKRAGGLLLCGLMIVAAVSARAADMWGFVPTISPTTTYSANRLCYTDGRDIACNATAPYVTSGGLLGIGTSNPQTALEVNGTISASGLTVNGQPVSGGGSADRIVSTSANVVAYAGGTVSITTGGVSGTAYFDTAGRMVLPGISATTAQASFTTIYTSGKVGVGTASPSANLEVGGPVALYGTPGFRLSSYSTGEQLNMGLWYDNTVLIGVQ